MDLKEIEGKEVIAGKARILGKVVSVEIDTENWKVTNIQLEVDKNVLDELGLKKPMLGSVKITFPVEIVDGISDKIILKETVDQLKNIIKKI